MTNRHLPFLNGLGGKSSVGQREENQKRQYPPLHPTFKNNSPHVLRAISSIHPVKLGLPTKLFPHNSLHISKLFIPLSLGSGDTARTHIEF
jgi:hypothetical protein